LWFPSPISKARLPKTFCPGHFVDSRDGSKSAYIKLTLIARRNGAALDKFVSAPLCGSMDRTSPCSEEPRPRASDRAACAARGDPGRRGIRVGGRSFPRPATPPSPRKRRARRSGRRTAGWIARASARRSQDRRNVPPDGRGRSTSFDYPPQFMEPPSALLEPPPEIGNFAFADLGDARYRCGRAKRRRAVHRERPARSSTRKYPIVARPRSPSAATGHRREFRTVERS
jgi:hypothetical protein